MLEKDIRSLLGDPQLWCSKSPEVKYFRQTMRELAEQDAQQAAAMTSTSAASSSSKGSRATVPKQSEKNGLEGSGLQAMDQQSVFSGASADSSSAAPAAPATANAPGPGGSSPLSAAPSSLLLPRYISSDMPPGRMPKTVLGRINIPMQGMTKTIPLDLNASADECVQTALRKLAVIPGGDLQLMAAGGSGSSGYVFKVTGLAEYVFGSEQLKFFTHVQNCVIKGTPYVDLSLIDRNSVAQTDSAHYRYDAEAGPAGILPHSVAYLQRRQRQPSHADVTLLADNGSRIGPRKRTHLSVWDLQSSPFRIRVSGSENVSLSAAAQQMLGRTSVDDICLYVTCQLHHGAESIGSMMATHMVPFDPFPRWNVWLESHELSLSQLPPATKVCVTLWARFLPSRSSSALSSNPELLLLRPTCRLADPRAKQSKFDAPLGSVNVQVYDYNLNLRFGGVTVALWPDQGANPIAPSVGNVGGENAISLTVEFQKFALPVVFPSGQPPFKTEAPSAAIPPEEALLLEQLIDKDPLYQLTDLDKQMLWRHRLICARNPKALDKVMSSVPWTDPAAVYEARLLLEQWAPVNAIDALALLDANHADPSVREYAVERLEELSDEKLQDLILQLSQVLKYEPSHDSSLARYLLHRALASPHLIGHILFWQLKAEMHVAYVAERFGLILETYLRTCGSSHRQELLQQNAVLEKLRSIAYSIKSSGKKEKSAVLREMLANVELPPRFKLPLSPRLECKGLLVQGCKVMDSKKQPLWLVFENADPTGRPIMVIFKAGDDLRQDQLTLQMLRIMDKVWKESGLDCRLIPYGCVSTGDGIGYIEVVPDAETTAAITREAGGARAAFKEDPVANWLRKHNKMDSDYRRAVANFLHSLAAYCVATYVLGIGDRHNDNIMVQQTGTLFHIDFGHFLGNYKTFGGWKRETAPFVFTPDFCYVLGGTGSEDFKKFSDLCGRAYNVLRSKGDLFINLFKLMLSTGIPELQSADDIVYMRNRLLLGHTEQEAYEHFSEEILSALRNKRLQLNNWIHIKAH